MLKVLELFAGIGACSKALTNLGIEHEIVDAVEIDKWAVKSFNAVHGTNFEPQDITKWDKNIEVDLIMHGSPCQDFSLAGLQKGGNEGSGTRSSLMYETIRIVDKLKPKYVIWENVRNLLSNNHKHNFDKYIEIMDELGYDSVYRVLNAKDYGVPQNRERVFTVSIRKDKNKPFDFPTPIPLEKKLSDVLDKEVDPKFYLSSVQIENMAKQTYNTSNIKSRLRGDMGRTITAREHKDPQCVVTPLQRKVCDTALEKGLVEPNDAIEYTFSNARLKEMEAGWIKKQNRTDNSIISTLKTKPDSLGVTVEREREREYAIRKLTPKECWRLMGFSDEDFAKAEKFNSNSQLYKQAGNSIVVNVLMGIFKNLL